LRPVRHCSGPVKSRWHTVCASAELAEGRARRFGFESWDVLLVRVNHIPHAVDNICTHAHACLHEGRIRGSRVICPLHGAAFDLRTGAALSAPALRPLNGYDVRETAGYVEVRLPSADAR
jgi:nitrite reductase/ring-hydroxylating ferredoxin subunit